MTPKGRQFEQYLQLPHVLAFLDTIAWAEGGRSYTTLFGGGNFTSFATHPNRAVRSGGYTSTAAGRYQELKRTFDLHSRTLGTTDFSPHTQDLHALAEVEAKGALSKLLAGDFLGTLKALGANGRCAWAALPYAGCNQRMRSYADTLNFYNSALAGRGGGNAPIDVGLLATVNVYASEQPDATISKEVILVGGLILLLLLI